MVRIANATTTKFTTTNLGKQQPTICRINNKGMSHEYQQHNNTNRAIIAMLPRITTTTQHRNYNNFTNNDIFCINNKITTICFCNYAQKTHLHISDERICRILHDNIATGRQRQPPATTLHNAKGTTEMVPVRLCNFRIEPNIRFGSAFSGHYPRSVGGHITYTYIHMCSPKNVELLC